MAVTRSILELETPEQISVPSPIGTPDLEASLVSDLFNDDSREWQALTFQLEGLDGFQSCRLDDTFIFFGDGTYRYHGGEVLCGGADDTRVKTGLWEDLRHSRYLRIRQLIHLHQIK